MTKEQRLPEFEAWSIAAVRLLQGVVYSDDPKVWDIVLSAQTPLETWAAQLGLMLVVDEPEGLAYLRQLAEDERSAGYEKIPRLFRRSRLGYDTTVLSVLLRDELRRFEEEDVHNERCVVETAALLEDWKTFFPTTHDDVRNRRDLIAALRKLEDLRFVKKFSDDPDSWEIRRILKARLPVSELENLKKHLEDARRESTSNAG